MNNRQTLELVDGTSYFTEDDWQTIWRAEPGVAPVPVTDKLEADNVRYLALVQAGTHEEKKGPR